MLKLFKLYLDFAPKAYSHSNLFNDARQNSKRCIIGDG